MTDKQMIDKWLETHEPTVVPIPDDIPVPFTGKLESASSDKFDKHGKLIRERSAQDYGSLDEAVRNY